MKFGLHLGTRGVAGTPDGLNALALKAESLGFEHLGFSDHVVIATDVDSVYPYTANGKWFAQDTGYCLDQLSLLSFVAGFTDTIRLLTSVMVVPYRHPVLTAKMLATADVVSKGRITVGIGAGWMAEEMALLDSPPHARRGKVTDEYVQAFRNLWSEPLPELKKIHLEHKSKGKGPLKDLSLFTSARLSVQKVTKEEFQFIVALSNKYNEQT